ncbi:hypothetical protein PG993_002470 [Apiospora rasikravindrae]|uniref:Uncharacterized protein n=1 Tax=Apiospora rasikravindrae TaxID=990691 RepID=A0ABR1TWR3_9PEZI
MSRKLSEQKVQAVSFCVSDPDYYVFADSDPNYGYQVPGDCEELCRTLDASEPKAVRLARRKERAEVKLRRELREVAALKADLEQKVWRAKLAESYYVWKTEADGALSPSAPPLARFPQLAAEVCLCEELTCKFEKERDGGLAACEHDLEQVLRASGQYGRDWLRKERLRWHPDQIGRRCDPQLRDLLVKQATAMYAQFEVLIANERSSVRGATPTGTGHYDNCN